MEIICFIPLRAKRQQLNTVVFNSLPKQDHVEILETISDVTKRLCQPKQPVCITILCPTDIYNLVELVAKRDYFINTNVIVVLPDSDQATLNQAQQLYPRFMIFADENLHQIRNVLDQIRRHKQQKVKYELCLSKAVILNEEY